jgi:prepilin-type N-terminal cleavage/methylation domain-containing protein
MGGRDGFSLPEMLVVLSLLFLLLSSIPALNGSKNHLLLGIESSLVASRIRNIQAQAISTGSVCRFDSSTYGLPAGIVFAPNRIFSFSSSGFPPPGGSGTLTLKAGGSVRRIIVSSYGRVRVE